MARLQTRIAKLTLGERTLALKAPMAGSGGGGGSGSSGGGGGGSASGDGQGPGKPGGGLTENFNRSKNLALPFAMFEASKAKMPPHLAGKETVNKAGDGYRWEDTTPGKRGRDYIRIDAANPNGEFSHLRVPHVVIFSNGQQVDRFGNRFSLEKGQKTRSTKEAHIPYDEWVKWKKWDSPE